MYYCPNSCMSLPSLNKSKTGLLKLLISTNSLKIFQQERFKLNYTLLLNTKSRTFYKKYFKKNADRFGSFFCLMVLMKMVPLNPGLNTVYSSSISSRKHTRGTNRQADTCAVWKHSLQLRVYLRLKFLFFIILRTSPRF